MQGRSPVLLCVLRPMAKQTAYRRLLLRRRILRTASNTRNSSEHSHIKAQHNTELHNHTTTPHTHHTHNPTLHLFPLPQTESHRTCSHTISCVSSSKCAGTCALPTRPHSHISQPSTAQRNNTRVSHRMHCCSLSRGRRQQCRRGFRRRKGQRHVLAHVAVVPCAARTGILRLHGANAHATMLWFSLEGSTSATLHDLEDTLWSCATSQCCVCFS